MNTPLDQNEVLAENASLDLIARNLRAQLSSKGQTPPAPPAQSCDCLEQNEALRNHVADLQARLTTGKSLAIDKPITEQAVNETQKVLNRHRVANLDQLREKKKQDRSAKKKPASK